MPNVWFRALVFIQKLVQVISNVRTVELLIEAITTLFLTRTRHSRAVLCLISVSEHYSIVTFAYLMVKVNLVQSSPKFSRADSLEPMTRYHRYPDSNNNVI